MTEVRFYHLKNMPLDRALPGILTQAHKRGMRVVVKCADENHVKGIDDLLWQFEAESFLPHGFKGAPQDQPIWISTSDENVNDASVLVVTDGSVSEALDGYDLCCEIFDGMDQSAVEKARARWKNLKDTDCTLKYYQRILIGKVENSVLCH
mgnify:CR=1 FL=1